MVEKQGTHAIHVFGVGLLRRPILGQIDMAT